MEKQKLFIVLISLLFFSSCNTTYYQLYKAKPSELMTQNDNAITYEDENCIVRYNLWSNGGNIGFSFYNKTDENIYLNLEESFFILNGLAYNYYKNRTYTSSKTGAVSSFGSAGVSADALFHTGLVGEIYTGKVSAAKAIGVASSSGFSVSHEEENIVCIPPKTAKIIAEYTINQSLFRGCNLYRYPAKKQTKINSISFSKNDSPFVFSNRIAYTAGKDNSLVRIENEFYVSEISNHHEENFYKIEYDEYCGRKNVSPTKYFRYYSADNFFTIYTK